MSLECHPRTSGGNDWGPQHCLSDINIYLIDSESKGPFTDKTFIADRVLTQYHINSTKCKFEVITDTLSYRELVETKQLIVYIGMIGLIVSIEAVGAYMTKRKITKTQRIGHLSIGSLWLIATCDYYMLILNLVMMFAFSSWLIIAFLLYVVLIFCFERQLIMAVL